MIFTKEASVSHSIRSKKNLTEKWKHLGIVLSGKVNIISYWEKAEGDVGVNENYLPHASNSVISSSLAIRFTGEVSSPHFSSPSRDVKPRVHPASLVLACPLVAPLLTLCQPLFPFAPTSPLGPLYSSREARNRSLCFG
jgi:hypothetical protein